MGNNLRKTAASKGMGGFLQVTQLVERYPEVRSFFSIVTGMKPAPPGVENASLVVILDSTPLDGVTEVALNQSNTNRIIKFLEREFGSADDSNLLDCALYFRIKEYPGFLAAGMSQFGLELYQIDPPEFAENARSMTFEVLRPEPVVIKPEESPVASRILDRRARIAAALNNKPVSAPSAGEPVSVPFTSESVLTKDKKAVSKKRK